MWGFFEVVNQDLIFHTNISEAYTILMQVFRKIYTYFFIQD